MPAQVQRQDEENSPLTHIYNDKEGLDILPIKQLVNTKFEKVKAEINTTVATLMPTVDWDVRLASLKHLEAILKNKVSATNVDALSDVLGPLCFAIVEQMQDRRSQVSRQACHTATVLVAIFGIHLESHAPQLLNAAFKAQSMGMQPVTDAADDCARSIIDHCPLPRQLLPPLCETLAHDKNAKQRLAAAEYLLHVLQNWQPKIYMPHAHQLEKAILEAAQDAGAPTRAVGRFMFVAYARKNPDDATKLLHSIPDTDRVLKSKLSEDALEAGCDISTSRNNRQPTQQQHHHVRRASFSFSVDAASTNATTASTGITSLSESGGIFRSISAQSSLLIASTPKAARILALAHSLQPRREYAAPEAVAGGIPQAAAPSTGTRGFAFAPMMTPRVRVNPGVGGAARVQVPALAVTGSSCMTPASIRPQGMRFTNTTGAPGELETATPSLKQPASLTTSFPAGLDPIASTFNAKRKGRQSLGGAALRVAASRAAMATGYPGEGSDGFPGFLSCVKTDRKDREYREQCMSVMKKAPPAMRVQRTESVSAYQEPRAHSLTEIDDLSRDEEPKDHFIPLPKILAALSKPGVGWSDKIDLYNNLTSLAQQSIHCTAFCESADLVVKVLCDGAGDAHFKVATAALVATSAVADHAPKTFDQYLERVMPLLFQRAVDAKEQIRQPASSALDSFAVKHHPDLVLAALVRALDYNRAPKSKVFIMKYFKNLVEDALPEFHSAVSMDSHPHLRPMIVSCLNLATNKNPDIRRAAVAAVAAAYNKDCGTVAWEISEMPSSPQAAIRKALAPSLSTIHADVQVMEAANRQEAPLPETMTTASPLVVKMALGRIVDENGLPVQLSPINIKSPVDMIDIDTCETPSPIKAHHPNSTHKTMSSSKRRSPGGRPVMNVTADSTTSMADAISEIIFSGGKRGGNSSAKRRMSFHPTDIEMEVLLKELEKNRPDEELLKELDEALPKLSLEQTERYVPQIFESIERLLSNREDDRKAFSLGTLQKTIKIAPGPMLVQHAACLLSHLLDCCAGIDHEVARLSTESLKMMLDAMDVAVSFALLLEYLPDPKGTTPPFEGKEAVLLIAVLTQLQFLLEKMGVGQLTSVMDLMFPCLCFYFGSAHAEIRKLTVKAIVQCWKILGSTAIDPYLKDVTVAQRKLLSIRYERSMRETETC